jgi:IclR family pca regulon transcriptional regulator
VGESERPVTPVQIAQRSGLSRAAVRRLLLTLEHLGYVRAHDQAYRLTPRILEFGHGFLGATSLTDVAQPWMEQLAHQIHESCSMAVLDDQNIVYVARVAVRKVMTVSLSVGARLPAFCTSMGRVLLAGLEPRSLTEWLGRCHPTPRTDRTVTDLGRLDSIIGSTRREGYAWVEQELEAGLCSLAVPLRDREGHVVAALNTGMPFHASARERALTELLPALRNTAQTIESAMPPRWLTPVQA